MIEQLQKLGFTLNQSKVISILLDEQWHTMREIEVSSDLCQPIVSLTVKSLVDYIEIGRADREGKGAPLKPVRIKSTYKFLNNINNAILDDANIKMRAIKELRSNVPSLHEEHDNGADNNA